MNQEAKRKAAGRYANSVVDGPYEDRPVLWQLAYNEFMDSEVIEEWMEPFFKSEVPNDEPTRRDRHRDKKEG